MVGQLFLAVLNMNISAIILFLLVLLGRVVLRQYGTAGFRYLLWIPFLLRLLIPYSLPSAFSLYNLFHNQLSRPSDVLLSIVYLDPSLPQEEILASGQSMLEKQLLAIGGIIWFIGAISILFVFVVQYFNLRSALALAYPANPEDTKAAARLAGLATPPAVLYTRKVKGPLVFGCLRARVLLPIQLKETSDIQKYILIHEFSHIRWCDHIILLLSCLALALHWFNPLIWVARSMMACDIERACDQRVLQKVGAEEQISYAQALVKWAGQRRFGISGYAAFGEQDVTHRVKGILNWKRLPRWAEAFLGAMVVGVFLCTATNPMLPNSYVPVSSPFVSEQQQQRFQQVAYALGQALETADASLLANLSSMDPAYFSPVYQNLTGLSLSVSDMRIYYNSNESAEVYLDVTVADGANLYARGKGTLIAHLSQTEYRYEPFVDCLMPQEKYEKSRLADTDSEAARLAVRLNQNLTQSSFETATLSPIVIAQVCMASAIEDKGESPPFSPQRMQQLAMEYFAIEDFSCQDPAVYDSANDSYFYTSSPNQQMVVTEMNESADGSVRVVVESYDDPLCLYPLKRLECNLEKTD